MVIKGKEKEKKLVDSEKKDLKEDEVDEVKNEAWPVEPEKVITGLNQWRPLNHLSSLLDPQSHLCYDNL